MKKIVVIFILLFLCTGIKVKGIEFNESDYLKEIQKDSITIGVQNKNKSLQNFNDSHLAKYLKGKLNLNVNLKKVSEEEGINELLSQKIDFLENTSVDDNKKIKYLNYKLLNNIIIVCRYENKHNYALNQLANKKVGIINKKEIKNYPIQVLSGNNNIKLYRNFSEMAKALEDKDIDFGISDKENRFELLLYDDITLAENRYNWSWREGIATGNSKYYKLIDIINNNIANNSELVNDFFDNKKDCEEKIKKAFKKSLNSEEKEYIINNKNIKVLASKDAFPILYEETSNLSGLLNYFMNIFSSLSEIKIEYITKNNISDNSIEEKIEYESYKHKEIPNIIYRTNLVMVSYNNNDFNTALSYITRTDKSIIGIPKQIQLNNNSNILENNIKCYESINCAIKGLKSHEVNFILMDRPTFDYYSLKDEGKNLIEFKELDNSAIYYLDTNNKILNDILKKVHKIYYIEKTVNRAQWNNIKDYMQKNYINTIYNRKQFYKFLIIAVISSFIIAMIFIIINNKNIDINKKLEGILKQDSNLDIIEINFKSNKVKCKTGLIFNSSKKLNLDEFLKLINLSREFYLSRDKINTLKEPKEVLVNGESKYIKQCIHSLRNKKLMSIITDVTQEVKEKNELKKKIRIDKLTGLVNRDYYEEEIKKIINKNQKNTGAFLFIDIDNFKNFNDKFGHDFGDKVIKVIGCKLKNTEDDNTLAFRIAGDEFGVYRHKIQNEDEIRYFLKKLCNDLTLEENYNDFIINVSCSIGCIYFDGLKNIGVLRNNAEANMYKCKKKKDIKSRYELSCFKENN